jgi:hypothetical protein
MRFNRALLLLPLIAACTTPADQYPSLALRDAERVTGVLQPAEPGPYTPPPTPASTLDRVAQLSAQATSANEAFLAEAPRARSAIAPASGAEPGGDAWARAQVALATLQAARSPATVALADLDRLYVDAATEGVATDRISAARDAVAAQVARQDATIATLSEGLR